jgi:hypothetical protein
LLFSTEHLAGVPLTQALDPMGPRQILFSKAIACSVFAVTLVGCVTSTIPPTLSGGVALCPGSSDGFVKDLDKIALDFKLKREELPKGDSGNGALRLVTYKYRQDDVAALIQLSAPDYLDYQLYDQPFQDKEKFDVFAGQFKSALLAKSECNQSAQASKL